MWEKILPQRYFAMAYFQQLKFQLETKSGLLLKLPTVKLSLASNSDNLYTGK